MRTTKGYILTGGAGIMLLFVVILSHILLNKDTLLPLVDNALDSIVLTLVDISILETVVIPLNEFVEIVVTP